jgi:hypothetical protein
MTAHLWQNKSGKPWTPQMRSAVCALCGHTPDSADHRAADMNRAEIDIPTIDALADALAVVFAYNASCASVAPNGSTVFGGEPTSYWRDRAEAVAVALRGTDEYTR